MKETRICVIGLGYVGLPLARLFSTKYPTIGFDMSQARVDALMTGHDATLEVADDLLQDAIKNHGFRCTTKLEDIKDCNFYVVVVPTPIDENNHPDVECIVYPKHLFGHHCAFVIAVICICIEKIGNRLCTGYYISSVVTGIMPAA